MAAPSNSPLRSPIVGRKDGLGVDCQRITERYPSRPVIDWAVCGNQGITGLGVADGVSRADAMVAGGGQAGSDQAVTGGGTDAAPAATLRVKTAAGSSPRWGIGSNRFSVGGPPLDKADRVRKIETGRCLHSLNRPVRDRLSQGWPIFSHHTPLCTQPPTLCNH